MKGRVIMFLALAVVSAFYFGLVDTSQEHRYWGMKLTIAMLGLAALHFLVYIRNKRHVT